MSELHMADGLDRKWFFSALERRRQSLRKLAKHMGLDPSAVSRIVSGDRQLKAHEQDQIAAFLGVSPEEVSAHRTGARASGAAEGGLGEMEQTAFKSVIPKQQMSPLFGFMKGTTIVMPGVDLTQPADPDLARIFEPDYDPEQIAIDQIKSDIALSVVGKIWALEALGLTTADIAKILGVAHEDVDEALAARVKVRGW